MRGLDRLGLGRRVFELLGDARHLDAALGQVLTEFAVDAFELLEQRRFLGGLFKQVVARDDEAVQLLGQRRARGFVAGGLRGQRFEFAADRLEPGAGAVPIAADGLEFALGLRGLSAVLVQFLPHLPDEQGELGGARCERLEAAAVAGEFLFQRCERFAGVGDQQAAREGTGDLAVRHPELDAAVGVKNGAVAGDDATPGRDRFGNIGEFLGQENVVEQTVGGGAETVGNRHVVQQWRKPLRRFGLRRFGGRVVGDHQPRGRHVCLGRAEPRVSGARWRRPRTTMASSHARSAASSARRSVCGALKRSASGPRTVSGSTPSGLAGSSSCLEPAANSSEASLLSVSRSICARLAATSD